MKINSMKNSLCLGISIIALSLSLSSCRDQEFDWEEAYRNSIDYSYKETFQSIFGDIAPDQSWDFSVPGATVLTRANSVDFTITKNENPYGRQLYPVEQTTLNWMKQNLPDGTKYNKTREQFELYSPGEPVYLIPIYIGNGSLGYDLHIVVNGTDDRVVWSKNQDMKVLTASGSANNIQLFDIVGYASNDNPKDKNRYLQGFDLSGTEWYSQTSYAVVTYGGNEYLLCLPKWANGFACGFFKVDNRGNLSVVDKITEASIMSRSNNELKIGNYYLYTDGTTVKSTTSTRNHNYNYKWTFSEYTETVDRSVEYQLDKISEFAQNNRNTSLNYYTWEYLPDEGAESCTTNTENALQVMSPVFKIDGLPANTRFEFYLKITAHGNSGSSDYAAIGDEQKSNDPNNPMMIVLEDVPHPTNLESYIGVSNLDAMLLACEDSKTKASDWDYNDVVFLIAGNPLPSKVPFGLSKRYMVEDLGTDPNTPIGTLGKTDFDFNDIVVDLCQITQGKDMGKQKAFVRALGGTIDFDLYVGDRKIFSKGEVLPGVTLHEDYSSFNVPTMYNTGYESDKGSYNGEYDSNLILAEVDLGDDQIWDYEENNIYFELKIPKSGSEGVLTDEYLEEKFEELKYIYFPGRGDVPRILAFDVSKDWMHERQPISMEWIKTNIPGPTVPSGAIDQTLYRVALSSNNSNWGTVKGSGSYADGSFIQIEAIAKDGYVFERWGDGNTSPIRNITVHDNVVLQAFFVEGEPSYNVYVYTDNTSQGSFTVSFPDGSGDPVKDSYQGKLERGTKIHVSATPASGYVFGYWYDGEQQYESAERDFVISSDIRLQAVFIRVTYYNITARANNNTYGTVTGGGTYAAGSEITLIANANQGYIFDYWEDDKVEKKEPFLRTVKVTEEKTYTAVFRKAKDGEITQTGDFVVDLEEKSIVSGFDDQIGITFDENTGLPDTGTLQFKFVVAFEPGTWDIAGKNIDIQDAILCGAYWDQENEYYGKYVYDDTISDKAPETRQYWHSYIFNNGLYNKDTVYETFIFNVDVSRLKEKDYEYLVFRTKYNNGRVIGLNIISL